MITVSLLLRDMENRAGPMRNAYMRVHVWDICTYVRVVRKLSIPFSLKTEHKIRTQ